MRLICGDIVNHPSVQNSVIFLTVVNAVLAGVATYDFAKESPSVTSAFVTTNLVFLIVYTIELVMQLLFRGYTLFKDGWLVFDLVIIASSWSATLLQVFRIFRILRIFMLITRIKSMRDVVTALINVLPRLGAIVAFLGLILYIFAVLFTELFGDLLLSEDYFSTLGRSMLTLYPMVTLWTWASVTRECMAQIWWAWAPFILFIIFSGFALYSLIIAMIFEAVAKVGELTDQERSKPEDADKDIKFEADFNEFLDSLSHTIKIEEY